MCNLFPLTIGLQICNSRGMSNQPFIGTRITRNGIECDVVIFYECTYWPRRTDSWDDPTHEPEFQWIGADFDADAPPDDANWPLTGEEIAALQTWFIEHYNEVLESYCHD